MLQLCSGSGINYTIFENIVAHAITQVVKNINETECSFS